MPEINQPPATDAEISQEIRKSNVRVNVTYIVITVYAIGSVLGAAVLLLMGKLEMALAVFNGFATLTAGIVGFWFGSRGTGFSAPSTPGGPAQTLIGPDQGASKRPAMEAAKPAKPAKNAVSPSI